MLISKDENIKTSPVFVASLILKQFQLKKVAKMSIFDISQSLKKHEVVQYRHILFGLTFLFSTSIIDFKEPYFYITND